jgi:hypothetical protein
MRVSCRLLFFGAKASQNGGCLALGVPGGAQAQPGTQPEYGACTGLAAFWSEGPLHLNAGEEPP